MALQIEIPTTTGVTGNYLRIVKINSVDVRKKTAEVILSVFLNKKASDEGKSPLQSRTYAVEISDINGNIRQQAYAKLKEQPTAAEKKTFSPSLKHKGQFNNVSLEKAKDV